MIILIVIAVNIPFNVDKLTVESNTTQLTIETTVETEPITNLIIETEEITTELPEQEPQIDNTYNYTIKEVVYIAKVVQGEAGGLPLYEKSAVIWCILNRVESKKFPNDIISVITQYGQFSGYASWQEVTDTNLDLAIDVLTRWNLERNGEINVGRTLPKDYYWFLGGKHFMTSKWKDKAVEIGLKRSKQHNWFFNNFSERELAFSDKSTQYNAKYYTWTMSNPY